MYDIGIGHTQLLESVIHLEMSSCNGFIKIQSDTKNLIYESSWVEMQRLDKEKNRLVLECYDIDTDGIPMCTVIVDGQWPKRSYKTKYNGLSRMVPKF